MNRLGAVGASLPLGARAELAPARSPYVWSDLSDSRLQFAGHPELADSLEVKVGSAAGGS